MTRTRAPVVAVHTHVVLALTYSLSQTGRMNSEACVRASVCCAAARIGVVVAEDIAVVLLRCSDLCVQMVRACRSPFGTASREAMRSDEGNETSEQDALYIHTHMCILLRRDQRPVVLVHQFVPYGCGHGVVHGRLGAGRGDNERTSQKTQTERGRRMILKPRAVVVDGLHVHA